MPALTTPTGTTTAPGDPKAVALLVQLRGRMLLMLVLATLPLLAFVTIGTLATYHARLDWLDTELRDAARQAAAREAEELGRAAALLDAVAATPMPAASLCAALRDRLPGGPAHVTAIAVHLTDVRPACAEAIQDTSVINSLHVRAALSAEGAVILAADPAAGLVLSRSLPVADGTHAVLALALAPAHPPPLTVPLRRDHAVRLLVDPADGAVLASQTGPASQTSQAARGEAATLQLPRVLADLRDGIADGVVVSRDAGGARRLTGYAELPLPAALTGPDGTSRAALLVELSYEELLAEAQGLWRDQWLAAIALMMVGVVVASMLANRHVLQPLRRVLAPVPGSPQARDLALASLRPAGAWLRQQADMAAVTEAAGELFLRLDAGFRVHYASPATRRVLGYAPSEVVDADLAAEPGWEACQSQLEALRRGEAAAPPSRILAHRRDDAVVPLEVRATRLGDGGFMLVCRDISAEHGLQTQLDVAQGLLPAMSLKDPQSGLANRQRFDAMLGEENRRARRSQEPMSLLLVQLADWPAYAARRGAEETGDAVRRVARILSAVLHRPGDLAARLDDDLFAVLLPTSDRIGAQRIAERLQGALVAEWGETPQAALATAIGACSVLPLSDSDGPEAILDLAWQALREAEQGGGNTLLAAVVVPEPVAAPMAMAGREFQAS